MAEDPFAAIAQPAEQSADPFASIAQPATAAAAQAPATPGAFKRFVSNAASAAGVVSPEEGKRFFTHPLETAKGMLEAQGELGKEAGQEFKAGDYPHAIQHGIEYLLPGVGPVLAKSGKQLESKDYAGGLGTMVGAGATVALDPEAVRSGLSKVGELRTAAREAIQPTARRFTGIEPAVKDAVEKAGEKQTAALEKNKVERVDTVKENLQKQRDKNYDIEKARAATAEKNRGIEAHNKGLDEQGQKRSAIEKTVDEQSLSLGKKLDQVESAVGAEANRKFAEVRAKIGNPEVEPAPLVDAVKNAETAILQGIPENIKEFHSILGHEEIELSDAAKEKYEEISGEAYEGPEPLTWDKLQSLKSRIDTRLRQGRTRPMNGDLKRALYSVQNVIVDTMGGAAEAAGGEELWQDAKNFWRQYKEDFHEPTGPSGSGSPVAQALNAVDPKNIRSPFLRTQASTGNRALEILRKYPQFGGRDASTIAESLLKNHGEMLSIPERITPKQLKENPQVHDMPANKPAPEIPGKPVVDVNKVARESIAQRAKNWGTFNARDVGILASSVIAGPIIKLLGGAIGEGASNLLPYAAITYEGGKYAASRILNNPKVIDWLSKTPADEAAALAKIPGADKVRIVDGLTGAAIDASKGGKPVKLSPAARSLLGPANVARIAAQGGLAGQVNNRKDALQLLGR